MPSTSDRGRPRPPRKPAGAPPGGEPGVPEVPFETALERLEALVAQLEQGDLPLEPSLAAFEEGMQLARLCGRRLEQAEKRVQLLLEQESGAPYLEPLADDDAELGL
ncbi:MAG TPA: exodeoxyribonuclease VII small subunit [Candidatus Saccharimonadales bacterium]|nr:exodeoxyribonuclease VII small subunit [Candidatus Saccharimonadales bacterium]